MFEAQDEGMAQGLVGSSAVRVAVIEPGGVDLSLEDMRRNIWVNQGELPPGLFDTNGDGVIDPAEIAAFDCDPSAAAGQPAGDGLITVRDMECSATIRPADSNGNNVVDALDTLSDPAWADGIDNDDFDSKPATFIDDLVGWDFANNDNNPNGLADDHGTEVASVVAAEGNNTDAQGNPMGIAGLNWRVSLVPLQASIGTKFVRAQVFADAVAYVEAHGFEVANYSGGWTFEKKGANRRCGVVEEGATAGFEGAAFDRGRTNAVDGFAPLFPGATRTLYTLATGNNAYDVDDPAILDLPAAAMRLAPNAQGAAVVVGAAASSTVKAPFSSYGSASPGVDLFAPGVNWTMLLRAGLTCGLGTCNQQVCLDGSGNPVGDNQCQRTPACATSGSRVVCVNTGTSFAAPTVAGAAALLLSSTTRLRGDPVSARRALLNSAVEVEGFARCGSSRYRGRLLDAQRLLNDNAP